MSNFPFNEVGEVVAVGLGILFALAIAVICIMVMVQNPHPLQIVICLAVGGPSMLASIGLLLSVLYRLFGSREDED